MAPPTRSRAGKEIVSTKGSNLKLSFPDMVFNTGREREVRLDKVCRVKLPPTLSNAGSENSVMFPLAAEAVVPEETVPLEAVSDERVRFLC